MIGDMLKAVQFSLLNKVDDSKIFDKQSGAIFPYWSELYLGVLHKLRNIWNQRMRDFWKENGQLHRNVFIQTCSTFIDQLDIIKSIVGDEDGLVCLYVLSKSCCSLLWSVELSQLNWLRWSPLISMLPTMN